MDFGSVRSKGSSSIAVVLWSGSSPSKRKREVGGGIGEKKGGKMRKQERKDEDRMKGGKTEI